VRRNERRELLHRPHQHEQRRRALSNIHQVFFRLAFGENFRNQISARAAVGFRWNSLLRLEHFHQFFVRPTGNRRVPDDFALLLGAGNEQPLAIRAVVNRQIREGRSLGRSRRLSSPNILPLQCCSKGIFAIEFPTHWVVKDVLPDSV
jgi:hypothetical protein